MPSAPLVLIPGIQGRWEWMAPAIDALSRDWRVLTYSLDDDVGRRVGARPGCRPFDAYLDQVDQALDRAAATSAVVAGVSFGGLIAARYAAARSDRTAALVLVSVPSPRWRLVGRRANQIRHPLLAAPAFAVHAVSSLLPEIGAALPRPAARAHFVASYLLRAARYPASPRRMADRAAAWFAADLWAACRGITAPTLLITGEPRLDRVVPVASTLEYHQLIPQARRATLPRTGHIGLVTRPDEFAALLTREVRTSLMPADVHT